MINFIYDALNSFGQADLTAAPTEFPDIIDLGEARIDRMTVDVKHTGPDVPAGGTGITITVQGADEETFASPETLGVKTATLEELNLGKAQAAVSPSNHRFVRVLVTPNGLFTAGVVEAFVNTYIGK